MDMATKLTIKANHLIDYYEHTIGPDRVKMFNNIYGIRIGTAFLSIMVPGILFSAFGPISIRLHHVIVLAVFAIGGVLVVVLYIKKRRYLRLSADLKAVVDALAGLIREVKPQNAMLAEVLEGVYERALNVFSMKDKKYAPFMLRLCNELLEQEEFSTLVQQQRRLQPAFERLISVLRHCAGTYATGNLNDKILDRMLQDKDVETNT